MSQLLYPTTNNAVQKSLSAELAEGATSSVTLNSVTGIPNKPGVFVIDRIDSDGNLKDSAVREYVEYSGTSGSTLVTLTRGVGGSTDQVHSVGAIVEFIPDTVWGTRVVEALATVVTDANHQAVNTTNVVTPSGTQTLTNKTLTTPTLTSPVINTGVSGSAVLDDDTMATATNTTIATSESIKAYVDTQVASASSTTGWTTSADTWTYASATTFTIAGVDRTTTFTKGTRLKFTQTTAKYAVVISSSFSTDTTVTIAANTSYSIANAAITSPYYSYEANPQGYPGWFAFTTTYGGFSSDPTPSTINYSIIGNTCRVSLTATGNGTSNATTLTLTSPVAAANTESFHCIGRAVDNGSIQTTPAMVKLTSGSATMTFHKDQSENTWTGSGSKSINFAFFYQI